MRPRYNIGLIRQEQTTAKVASISESFYIKKCNGYSEKYKRPLDAVADCKLEFPTSDPIFLVKTQFNLFLLKPVITFENTKSMELNSVW